MFIGGAHQGLGGAKPPKFFLTCVGKKYKNCGEHKKRYFNACYPCHAQQNSLKCQLLQHMRHTSSIVCLVVLERVIVGPFSPL